MHNGSSVRNFLRRCAVKVKFTVAYCSASRVSTCEEGEKIVTDPAKHDELVSYVIEAMGEPDLTWAVSRVLNDFAVMAPPEDDFTIGYIVLGVPGTGGVSRKPGNLLLSWRRLFDADSQLPSNYVCLLPSTSGTRSGVGPRRRSPRRRHLSCKLCGLAHDREVAYGSVNSTRSRMSRGPRPVSESSRPPSSPPPCLSCDGSRQSDYRKVRFSFASQYAVDTEAWAMPRRPALKRESGSRHATG